MIHTYDYSPMVFSLFSSLPISPIPARSDFLLLHTFRRLKDFIVFEINCFNSKMVVMLLPLYNNYLKLIQWLFFQGYRFYMESSNFRHDISTKGEDFRHFH